MALVRPEIMGRLTSDLQKVIAVGDDNAKKLAEKVNKLAASAEPPAQLGFFGKLWAGIKSAIIPTAISSVVVGVIGGGLGYAMSDETGEARTAAAFSQGKKLAMMSGLIGGAFNIFGGYKTATAEREAERRLWSMIHGKPLDGSAVAAATPAGHGSQAQAHAQAQQEGPGLLGHAMDVAGMAAGVPPGMTQQVQGALPRLRQQARDTFGV